MAGSMVTPSPLGSASKRASGNNYSALARLARAYHWSMPTPEKMVFLFFKNQQIIRGAVTGNYTVESAPVCPEGDVRLPLP